MAKVFLNSDESYEMANNGAKVFSADGNETIILRSGTTGLEVDQNTEKAAILNMDFNRLKDTVTC